VKTVPVPPPRGRIEDLGSGLRVVMPPRRNVLIMVFLAVWLVGWFAAGGSVLRQIPGTGPQTLLLVWLAMWGFGGFFTVAVLAWMALGREILELRPDALIHRRAIFSAGITRAYDLASVKQLRLGPATPGFLDAVKQGKPDLSRLLEAWGFSGGPIVFDYGSRTIRCGAAIDEAEAKQIIDRFAQRDARLRPATA
jgi:hypothetical protein